MPLDHKVALQRGFVLKWASGSCMASPMSTIEELRFHLLPKNTNKTPKVLVLPGRLNVTVFQVLTSYEATGRFLEAHLYDDKEVHRPRGYRPQNSVSTYSWEIPELVCWCSKCIDEEYAYATHHRGPVMLFDVSLWLESSISILLVQRSDTQCWNTGVPTEPSFEEELREKLPEAGLNISIEDYVNQLAYERWVEFVAELQLEETSATLVLEAMTAVERNLDQARYMAACGKSVFVANEQAWEDILRRLERRLRVRAL